MINTSINVREKEDFDATIKPALFVCGHVNGVKKQFEWVRHLHGYAGKTKS